MVHDFDTTLSNFFEIFSKHKDSSAKVYIVLPVDIEVGTLKSTLNIPYRIDVEAPWSAPSRSPLFVGGTKIISSGMFVHGWPIKVTLFKQRIDRLCPIIERRYRVSQKVPYAVFS